MDTLGYSVTRSYWSIFQNVVTSCRANDRPGLEDRRKNGIPELSMVSPELTEISMVSPELRNSCPLNSILNTQFCCPNAGFSTAASL